jgi:phosphoserine phosphatase
MSSLPTSISENDERVRETLRSLVERARERPVFLVDGDRTLTPEDTSRTFLEEGGLDPMTIKARFKRDGYVFDAFRFHAEVHLRLGEDAFATLAPTVAARVRLYDGAAEFLHEASRRALVVVVSAGIPRVWRSLVERCGIGDVPVFGGIDPSNPFVFGRREKGLVTDLFRERASSVIGIGDSDVDTEMLLRAHHAVVVVNHRQNEDLVPHLLQHPSLWQVVPQGAAHDGIRTIGFSRLAHILDDL